MSTGAGSVGKSQSLASLVSGKPKSATKSRRTAPVCRSPLGRGRRAVPNAESDITDFSVKETTAHLGPRSEIRKAQMTPFGADQKLTFRINCFRFCPRSCRW